MKRTLQLTVLTGAVCLATAASAGWVECRAPNGDYLSGDFHQHTLYTDGRVPFDDVMEKNNSYGLDWWANSEHGGRRATDGNGLSWNEYAPNPIKGDYASTYGTDGVVMARWQSLAEYVFPDILRNRLLYPDRKIFSGLEWNVPGHEHCSTGIVADDASAISAFEFQFDKSDGDTSRVGEETPYGILEKRNVTHEDAVDACAWMQAQKDAGRIEDGWIVFAHIERNGPRATGGYDVSDFRDFNDAGPDVCFGFEGAPGHQTSGDRGGFGADAFGGTYGGAGYYTATVGGLWDALLGEGRRWFNFASSDFHSHFGGFTEGGGDFYPGEYQKDWVYVEDADHDGDYSYTEIVEGLRSGNSFHVMGDLVDVLEFTATSRRDEVAMGGELAFARGEDVTLTIRFKSPDSNTCTDYSTDPADCPAPVVDHVDLIAGEITGRKRPGTPEYNRASNPTAHVVATFAADDWKTDRNGYHVIRYTVKDLEKDVYFRLRGSNLAPNTPCETDPAGNPLPDFAASECYGSNFTGAKEAYADLWFYSNPIFAYREGHRPLRHHDRHDRRDRR